MNRRTGLRVALVALSFIAGLALVGQITRSEGSADTCSTNCIELRTDGAVPDSIAVTQGSAVRFIAADGKSHSLSLGKGGDEHEHTGPFSSGLFGKDEAWEVTFSERGSFFFHDHLNPSVNVLVVVYEPGGSVIR